MNQTDRQAAIAHQLDSAGACSYQADRVPLSADLAVLQDRGVAVRIAAETCPAEEAACHAS